jgi:hypothetical protein
MWNTDSDTEERFRTRAMWGSAVAVALIAIGAFVYYQYYAHPAARPEPVTARPRPAAQAPAQPEIQHPIPETEATKPLPALNESDQEVHDSLVGLLGAPPVEQFINPENIVRHIVATVDNLPRNKVAVELRPVKPTPGGTVVATQGDITTLSAANYARYAPVMKLVQSIDPGTLAAVYFRLYPLF